MQALSFILSGKTAFFKKPDVNQFAYFTYNNVHKPALLGILGAIMGLKGHTQLHNEKKALEMQIKDAKGSEKKRLQEEKSFLDKRYPEFYEKLKDLNFSIVPNAKKGYFSKKIQTFNNSVGYASKEMGGNLIVREQWLEEPSWQILILDDESEEFNTLKKYLKEGKCTYIPYLGKNDHPAKIDNIELLNIKEPIKEIRINSIFEEIFFTPDKVGIGESAYMFQEVSPISLQQDYHFYEYKNMIFTNRKIKEGDYTNVYSNDGKNYFFI